MVSRCRVTVLIFGGASVFRAERSAGVVSCAVKLGLVAALRVVGLWPFVVVSCGVLVFLWGSSFLWAMVLWVLLLRCCGGVVRTLVGVCGVLDGCGALAVRDFGVWGSGRGWSAVAGSVAGVFWLPVELDRRGY